MAVVGSRYETLASVDNHITKGLASGKTIEMSVFN